MGIRNGKKPAPSNTKWSLGSWPSLQLLQKSNLVQQKLNAAGLVGWLGFNGTFNTE